MPSHNSLDYIYKFLKVFTNNDDVNIPDDGMSTIPESWARVSRRQL